MTTTETTRRPLVRVRGLYYPTDHTPDEIFRAIGTLRKEAAAEIDRLIAFLDASEPDSDLEPSTGYVAPGHVDEGEPDGADEPSLGWTASADQGRRDSLIGLDDLEDEHDGREPDVDDEEDDPGEDNGDAEPSLVSAEGSVVFRGDGITDGEEGDLGRGDLAERQAAHRARRTTGPLADGSTAQFVYVNTDHRGCLRPVRPLTPREVASYIAGR